MTTEPTGPPAERGRPVDEVLGQARRIKRLEFTPGAIFSLRQEGIFRVTQAKLPADAQVVSSYYDPERDIFGIVIASKEFPPVASGSIVPYCDPVVFERCDDVD